TRVREGLQHLEVIAYVIAVVVREEHQHRLGLLAGHVLGEALLRGVLRRLVDREALPARVVPHPRVTVGDLLVVRGRQLDHATAEPAYGHPAAAHPAGGGRALPPPTSSPQPRATAHRPPP